MCGIIVVSKKEVVSMKSYVVVMDGFGFEVAGPFFAYDVAEEMRDIWNFKNKVFGVQYHIEEREE